MNNWFEFKLPYINEKFGADWSAFTTIVDDNVDYVMDKTFELYWLKDFGRMPAQALEYALKLRDIETTPSEALSVKRSKLRIFSTGYRNKGTADLYLNYAEAITGARGEIFQGYDSGYTAWGLSSWSMGLSEANARVWETPSVVYKIYVEPKVEEPGQAAMEAIEMYLPLELDALDISGNDNDGTATGIIYSDTPDMRMYLPLTVDDDDDSDFGVVTTPTNITYGADGAIFNGTSSRIACALSVVNITGWAIDFEFKHGVSLPAATETIWSNYQDSSNSVWIFLNTSGYIFLANTLSGATAYTQYKATNLCDGNSHRVQINFIDSTHVQITVDNSADTIKTLSVALATLTTPTMTIGRVASGYYYTGTIKNFRIFNRNLTTAEITQLYTYNTFTALSKKMAVFNGTTSRIVLSTSPVADLTGYSVSFKFKRNGVPSSTEMLWNNRADLNNQVYCRIQNSGILSIINIFDGAAATAITYKALNLCDNILHHVEINFISSTTVQITVDNSADTVKTLTVGLTTFTAPTLYIGTYSALYFFNGCISDFYIFNRNLTTAEATWLYEHNLDDEFYSKLDDIVDIYRQDFIRPAFYDMCIVNSNFKILRTV